MSEQEIFERVRQIGQELLQLLSEKKPELTELYKQRLDYALGPYPPVMRIHNAYQIFRTYIALKEEEWWAQCPPVIEVRVDAEADVVRYCFDYDSAGIFKGSHENDYYEEGYDAVQAAVKMARRFGKRLEPVRA